MHRKRSIGLVALITLLVIFSACKEPIISPDRVVTDTTSHNFVWRIDTLGDGNSSVLKDVAIIDQSNIWAVGQVYLTDSAGQFSEPEYGFAIWDGAEWTLRRYQVMNPTGSTSNLHPRGVIAFGSNDIWFASGGVFHWNGSTMTSYWINNFPGNPNPILSSGQSVEKLWKGCLK